MNISDNFRNIFISETFENLEKIEAALLSLNSKPDIKVIEEIFRNLHTVKGSGGMFGFSNISQLTHDLEDTFSNLREKKAIPDSYITELTLKVVDEIRFLLKNDDQIQDEKYYYSLVDEIAVSAGKIDNNEFSDNQEKEAKSQCTYFIYFVPNKNFTLNGSNPFYLLDELSIMGEYLVHSDTSGLPEIEKLKIGESYLGWRIILSTDKDPEEIDDVFLFARENSTLEVEKIMEGNLFRNKGFSDFIKINKPIEKSVLQNWISQANLDLKEPLLNSFDETSSVSNVKVGSTKIDKMMNILSGLVSLDNHFAQWALQSGQEQFIEFSEKMTAITAELKELTFEIALVPISIFNTRFERMVYDISLSLNKKVRLVVSGQETRLDKSYVDKIIDPVMHILRNAIDHGIEKQEERIRKGKTPVGNIEINCYYSGANVVIEISDDGCGIDYDIVLKKARELSLYEEGKEYHSNDIYKLLFLPGFSTAKDVTNLSGRGVGLDVIKKNISLLRGEISVSSKLNLGTTFRLILPQMLSIADGFLCKQKDRKVIIPVSQVVRIESVPANKITATHNIIVHNEQKIPMMILFCETCSYVENKGELPVIIVNVGGKNYGIVVEEILGTTSTVVRPLGPFLRDKKIFSGGSLLADGEIALVIDVKSLVEEHFNLSEYSVEKLF